MTRAAGLGFRSSATVDDLAAALALLGRPPDVLATDHSKAAAPAFLAIAQRLGVPAMGVTVAGVATQTRSDLVEQRFATGSVAEAAALAAAGPGAYLAVARVVTANGMATAALAEPAAIAESEAE